MRWNSRFGEFRLLMETVVWSGPGGSVDAASSQLELPWGGGLAVGTQEQFRWLLGIVKAIFVLNLLDALFTLAWVHAGLAEEANALMRDLVSDHTVGFMIAKLGLVSLGSILLWYRRYHPLAVVALFFTFLAYYLIFLYHLQFSSGLAFGLGSLIW